MPSFSKSTSRIVPCAILELKSKLDEYRLNGRKIIDLSIGVPGFLPGEHVYQAASDALWQDSGGYGASRGDRELIKSYLRYLEAQGITCFSEHNITIGYGAKHLIFSLIAALVDSDEEILIPAPYWPSYLDISAIIGAKVSIVKGRLENGYKITAEELAQSLNKNTKLFIFNNPSNPTGCVYTVRELEQIGEVLESHDVWILSDDIYNEFVFDQLQISHLLVTNPKLKDRLIIVDSVSKKYGMPGWRVGMMAGPTQVSSVLESLISNSVSNVNSFTSAAARAAFSGDQSMTASMKITFQQRRNYAYQLFNSLDGINCSKPEGAFYIFPDISGLYGRRHAGVQISSDVDFTRELLSAKGVAVVPGSVFGEPRAIRISYACDDVILHSGLALIKEFVEQLS